MAYPSVSFKPKSLVMGLQPISESSTVQQHPLGMTVAAFDLTYGEGEFVYLKGAVSTAAGDVVVYDQAAGSTTRALAGAVFGPAAVAMSANVAGQYGWYQVSGSGPVKAGTVAADAPAYLSGTAGQIDDELVVGALVEGMVTRGTDSGGFATVQLDHPSISGESDAGTLQVTLTAAAEDSDAIVVTGAVKTMTGAAVTAAKQVLVRTLAATDGKGDITVTAGTEKKTVNPAAGENVSWIETTEAGAFAFSVANDAAEGTLVHVTTEGGVSALLKLTFAA